MAIVKVRPGDKMPPATGPIYYSTHAGQIVASAKPRPRGRSGTQKQLDQQEWLTQAARALRYMDPEQIWVAKKLTQGFPVLWRDYLTQNLAGRFGVLQLEDGRQIHSMSEQQDVSDSLDAIGQAQGNILFRASAGWRVLAPGPAGRALTTQGPDADPTWTPSTGAWGLQEAVVMLDGTEHAFLNLAAGFEYWWVFSDLKADTPDVTFWAHISQDNGASWELGSYRFMGRIEGHTGLMFSYTTGLGIKVVRLLGTGLGKEANGVLQIVSDIGSTGPRKQFHGWDTTLDNVGTFHLERYAAIWEGNGNPINAVRISVSAGLFSGKITLWRRALA